MKVSLIQIDSGENKQANFEKAQKFVIETCKQNPDIVVLSENFLYRGDDHVKEPESISSKYIQDFQNIAKQNNVNLILGSIVLKTDNKPTNTSLVINRKGKIIYKYDKIYMYDVIRTDLTYWESDNIQPGNKLGIFAIEGIKMGVGICVDLRYPEYFRDLIKQEVEIIFLPSNFRKLTGELAWDVLTKARAIENQVYFCACGQTGGNGAKKRCGYSRIISYDGKIISELGQEEGIITADLDLEKQLLFRKQFPVLEQIK